MEFTSLQSALMILGFSNTELKAIYAVLAAIIHLSHTKIVKKGDKFNRSKMIKINHINMNIFITSALFVFFLLSR